MNETVKRNRSDNSTPPEEKEQTKKLKEIKSFRDAKTGFKMAVATPCRGS